MNIKRKYLILPIFLVVLVMGYIGWCYYRIGQEADGKAYSKFNLFITPKHVREIGYVLDLGVTRDLMKHQKKIWWWIKVPSTNEIYSCSWEAGFSEYEKNEGVILIHIPGGGALGTTGTVTLLAFTES